MTCFKAVDFQFIGFPLPFETYSMQGSEPFNSSSVTRELSKWETVTPCCTAQLPIVSGANIYE